MRRLGSVTAIDAGQPDDDLARLVLADSSAFPLLFDRYWTSVLRYCSHELGSWEDAEDAAQQTMIEVARSLNRFVSTRDGSFRSWIFTIARAKSIDVRRGRARRPGVPLPDDPPWSATDASLADAEARDWLLEALDALPPNERDVLVLRAAELTSDEIARVLNISEAAVRQRTKRARDHLRPMLAAQLERRHA